MRVGDRKTWVDRLGLARAATLAMSLHVIGALLSSPRSFEYPDEPLVWWASGTSVGLILAANRGWTRIAVVFGGVIGQVAYLSWMIDADFVRGLATHVLDVGLVSSLVVAAGRYLRVHVPQSTGLFRIVSSAVICSGAPALSFLVSGTNASVSFWTLSRGLGMLGVGSALTIGRARWLAMTHPREHRRELVISVGVVVLTLALMILADTAFFWLAMGLCLLIAVRFGLRIAAPFSLLLSISFMWIAHYRPGRVRDDALDSFDMIGTGWILIVLASLIGWLAGQIDGRIMAQEESMVRWKKLAHRGFDAFVEFDESHRIVDVSDSVFELSDAASQTLSRLDPQRIFDADSWSQIIGATDRVRNGETVRFERPVKPECGLSFPALFVIEPCVDAATNVNNGCMVYILDMTANSRRNEGRAASRAALATAQQDERTRVAKLVHDGALQDLAAANLLLGAARMQSEVAVSEPDSEPRVGDLARIEHLLTSGMQKLRIDAIAKSNTDLHDPDIATALGQTIQKFKSFTSLPVLVRVDLPEGLATELSEAIFRVANEAMVNALLHSNANLIEVAIHDCSGGYSVTVVDDGVGFNPDLLQEVGHLGLGSMSTVAHEIGGWFSLSTRPGQGTTVEAWLPAEVSSPTLEAAKRPPLDLREFPSRHVHGLAHHDDDLREISRAP